MLDQEAGDPKPTVDTVTDTWLDDLDALTDQQFWSRLRRAILTNERHLDRFNGALRAMITPARLKDTQRCHDQHEVAWFFERSRRKRPVRIYRVAPLSLLTGYLWSTSLDQALRLHSTGERLHLLTGLVELRHVLLRIQDGGRKHVVVIPEMVRAVRTDELEGM